VTSPPTNKPHNAATHHNIILPKKQQQTTLKIYCLPDGLLRIPHLLILPLALTPAGKEVLLLTAALDLISNELLVLLERALDVQLEAHDIVQHALDLRVQFFAQRVGAELELFVPRLY
jgi:hypothetical protein